MVDTPHAGEALTGVRLHIVKALDRLNEVKKAVEGAVVTRGMIANEMAKDILDLVAMGGSVKIWMT